MCPSTRLDASAYVEVRGQQLETVALSFCCMSPVSRHLGPLHLFFDTVSYVIQAGFKTLCSTDYGLEIMVLLLLPPECWDHEPKVGTQGFVCAMQALCQQSHIPSPLSTSQEASLE